MDPQRSFFEALAVEWDTLQPPHRGERLRQMMPRLDPFLCQAKHVLEVGTGTGALVPLLRERLCSGSLISIDLAHAMLVRAQKRSTSALLVQADVHRLPFGTEHFDAIVCHSSFPHFADKPAALLELKRTMHEGGWLIVFHDTSRAQVNAVHQNAQSPAIHSDLLPTGGEMRTLLESAGFGEVVVQDALDYFIAAARVAPQM